MAFTGAVVTLLPANPEALTVEGGDEPDMLHITLAWMGDTSGEDGPLPAEDYDAVVGAVRGALEAGPGVPVVADAFAWATFNPDGFDDTRDPATVLLLQSPDLAEIRGLIQETVTDLSDFPVWFPHLTLGYNLPPLTDEEVAARVGPVTFDRVQVAYGDERTTIHLEDTMAASARPKPKRKLRINVPDRYRTRTQTLATGASDEGIDVERGEDGELSDRWSGVLVVEGTPTGDGRLMEAGSLRWGDMPLPLAWAREDQPEHGGAVVVGRILEMWRDGDAIRGRGDLDLESPEGREVARLIAGDEDGPILNGVSVDLDDVDIEVRVAQEVLDREEAMFADDVDEEQPDREVDAEGRVVVWEFASDDELMVTTDARIRSATIVRVPAFAEAHINLDDTQALASEDDACPEGMVQDEDGNCVELPADETGEDTPNDPDTAAVVAGAAPDAPPRSWFDDPQLDGPTPLTVTDEGRVYGHLAPWDTCHTAFVNECVKPPASSTDYSYFHVGAVRTAEGPEVATGRITLDTLHAGRRLSAVDTLAHYEHTGLAVADVRAGEDAHGIYLAGALRPGVDPDQVRTLRASPLSGDWRRVGANLELVAALAVNSPGFPVPRAMVASGNVVALQSAGTMPPRDQGNGRDRLSDDELAMLRRMAAREAKAQAGRQDQAAQARRKVLAASAAARVNQR